MYRLDSLALLGMVAAAGFGSGCLVPKPDLKLPNAESAYIAVLSGEMPPPIDQVSRHAWIVVHIPGERDHRFEYGGGGTDALDDFTGGDIMLHGVVLGTKEEIRQKTACLRETSREERKRFPGYFPIPGPNSNTYVDYLLRGCSIPIELPATAIGRDYRGIAGVSLTESGTGVQAESIPVGVRLGLIDGIEAHLFGLALGVHFWPPGITVPVNPGRVGFGNDEHAQRPHKVDDPERFPHHRVDEDRSDKREYGLATGWLALHLDRIIEPTKVSTLEARSTVGFGTRALYGSTWGYGFGLGFELGAGVPASFAYAVHLFPMGVGYMFGNTGYIGLFAGIGTSGVTTLTPGTLELPLEARLETDVTEHARLGFVATFARNFGPNERERGTLLSPAFHEVTLGARARFGKTRGCYCANTFVGSGYFVGFERRELEGSGWLGLVLGSEIDAAK